MSADTVEFAQVMIVIVASTASFVAIGLGARVLWRRGSRQEFTTRVTHDAERQRHLESAIDAIAIEVERISEAQRFMVGLLSDPALAHQAERPAALAPPQVQRDGRVITPH